MTQGNANLDNYFSLIQQKGNIISEKVAKRWSESTLKMMGLYMGKNGKKALSNQLPKELSDDLNRVFRLMHFPNTNMPDWSGTWRDMTRRIAFWVDLDDPYLGLAPYLLGGAVGRK